MNKFKEVGEYVTDKSKELDFPKYIRIINLVIGGMLIFIGIWKIVTLQIFTNIISLKFFNVFIPFFFILFGAILFLAEMKPEIVFEYLKVLKTYAGLGSFYLFLSSLTVYNVEQETNAVFGWVYGILLFVIGVYYIILHFMENHNEQKGERASSNTSISSSYTAPLV